LALTKWVAIILIEAYYLAPMPPSTLRYIYAPTSWQDAGSEKLRQYFGCTCVGRADAGKNQTRSYFRNFVGTEP
jgi:hypothetical protein